MLVAGIPAGASQLPDCVTGQRETTLENPPCMARSTQVGARFTSKGTGQATVGVNDRLLGCAWSQVPHNKPISMGTSKKVAVGGRTLCRRKETTVRRRAASGPVDEGNGTRLPATGLPAGFVRLRSRSCGGVCGGRPSRDYIAAWEERTILDVLGNA